MTNEKRNGSGVIGENLLENPFPITSKEAMC